VFNAFLPCHLIYAFAARAASTGSVSEGALTMTAFGLGTVPALVAVSAVRRWFPPGLYASLSILSGLVVIGFALLTIARAFETGAPCGAHH
jgi:sulfite exporter TauE/SafE